MAYTREQKAKIGAILKEELKKRLAQKQEQRWRSTIEDSKIPFKVHLKALEQLAHARKHIEEFAGERKHYQAALEQMTQTEERLRSLPHIKGDKGDVGDPGRDAVSVEGRPGRHGKDAVTPTMDEIVNAVLPHLPKETSKQVDIETITAHVVREFQKGDKLHISHVRGASGFIKDGIKYRYEELMHGGGAATTAGVYYTPTGTVNAVNATFVVTDQPASVIADGITYFEGAGYSYTAPNITMDIPPSQYIRYTL